MVRKKINDYCKINAWEPFQYYEGSEIYEHIDRLSDDFSPLSDMRASAEYRRQAARNMFLRYFHDIQGTDITQVHEVRL